MTVVFDAVPVDLADLSPFPAADLATLFEAISRRRAAGLCGHHQHNSQPGCDAVAVWAHGFGPGDNKRPATLFCRDHRGRYRAFSGDGMLMASGSILDLIRLWK
jgi:hypothetical protein